MIHKRLTIYLTLILLSLTVAHAGPPGEEDADRVHEQILDNGLRVVVVERHFAPVFFSLISFRVGSNQELPNHSGLSHFLEHMLFKGSKTVGSTDYRLEKPIMDELESSARNIRDSQAVLQEWRYDMFERYATNLKANLPPEIRDQIGGDEAAAWQAVLDAAPPDAAGLPEDMRNHEWVLRDRGRDYWQMYRELLAMRIKVFELLEKQREYIIPTALDGIYDTHGATWFNAFTSNDQTTYMVGLPSNCMELWMFLESDRFQNPVFREFYSEREVVIEELRMRASEPGGLLHEALQKTAFQAHPYGRPVIGWMGDIRLTLRSDMERHFWNYYAPNNCQITIVGAVNPDEVFKMVRKYFASWKASEVAEEVTVTEPEQNGERRVQVEFDAEPRLMMAFHAPVAPHPDYYAVAMMDYILSSGRTSRFYRSIFEKQGLTAGSPGCGSPDGRYPEVITLYATPKAPHTNEEVEAALLAELEKLKTEPVSEVELERARNNFKSYRLARLRSNQWLAFEISETFVNRGDWRVIDADFDRLMSVGAADIQRVARTYFTRKNMTVATLIKPAAAMAAGETDGGDN